MFPVHGKFLITFSMQRGMDQISIKTPNPKYRLFLKIYQHRYFAAGVYLSEASSPPRFLFGVAIW
jgi:hypothetical protein